MSRPESPAAAHRHQTTSWLLAAVLLLAPLAAELGHTCLKTPPGEVRGHHESAAPPLTAAEKPPRSCPGCLHRVQGVGAIPLPLLLPEPAGADPLGVSAPATAPPAPPAARATARAPPSLSAASTPAS